MTLIQARPAVLTKDVLMAKVWPDTFVSDANLAVLIKEIRAALGDPARAPHFVRTHHTVGYSFIGDVAGDADPTDAMPGICAWLQLGERRIAIPQGETVIGRDPSCELPIHDASISRRHARLTLTGREATIDDLGSKNGTWVGGERIEGSALLGERAALTLGNIEMEFVLEPTADASTLTITPDR